MADYKREFIQSITTGIRMEVLLKGEGPLMVCLHGFPEMAGSWRHQLDYFGSRGWHVAAPNMRGYGETDRPEGGYDLHTLSDDIEGVIRHYGNGKAALVGHDWGGAVAWHYAYRHPETLAALIILNAPHPVRLEQVLRSSPGQRRKSLYMLGFQAPFLPEWYLGRNGARTVAGIIRDSAVRKNAFSEADLDEYARNMARPKALWAGIEYYREARRKASEMRNYYRDKKITVPTLVIWAQQDKFLGNELADGLEPFIDAPLEVAPVDNCGHWVQQEAPAEVNESIEKFLSKFS